MEDTMYGRTIQLNPAMPEDVIRMHPKTWERIRPVHRRNEIPVVTTDPKTEGFNGRGPTWL